MPISWFTDYRYGIARRRLAVTVLLALVLIVGAGIALWRKMSRLPEERDHSVSLVENKYPKPRVHLLLGGNDHQGEAEALQPVAESAQEGKNPSKDAGEDLSSAYKRLDEIFKEKGASACLENIEEILKDHPHLSPEILNLQAVAYSGLSAWPQAKAALLKALDQNAGNTRYLLNLAIVEQRMENYTESLKRLRQIESLGQSTSLVRTKIMLIRIQNGEAEAVRRDLRMQTDAAPLATGLRAPIVSAALALEKGDTEGAQRYLSRAARLVDGQTLQSYLSDPFFIRYRNHPAVFPYLLQGGANTNFH